MHALAYDGDELVGHASLIQRRHRHAAGRCGAGYVEGVGALADRQRQGPRRGMVDALERIIGSAYDLGRPGRQRRRREALPGTRMVALAGPSGHHALGAVRPAEEDGFIYVLPGGGSSATSPAS